MINDIYFFIPKHQNMQSNTGNHKNSHLNIYWVEGGCEGAGEKKEKKKGA